MKEGEAQTPVCCSQTSNGPVFPLAACIPQPPQAFFFYLRDSQKADVKSLQCELIASEYFIVLGLFFVETTGVYVIFYYFLNCYFIVYP